MDKFREKIAIRGTADCPFQRYNMKQNTGSGIISDIHWHPEAEILYMQHGTVEVRADKATFLLASKEIAFIPPGQLHSISGISENNRYSAFVFSMELLSLPETHFFQKELVEPLFSGQIRFPYKLTDTDDAYPIVSQALDKICILERNDPKYKRTVLTSVIQIFAEMMDKVVPGSSVSLNKSNEILKSCLAYMNQNFASRMTLQEIAAQVHLHPNYLCALFKDYTGQTVFQHLNRIRIEKAAELLRAKNITVSEAATQCGFESSSFFTKKFKVVMGIAPKEYSLQYK